MALRGTYAPILRCRPEIRPPAPRGLARWLYGRATDRILLPGEFARESTARALGLPRERIRVLPAGIARSVAPSPAASECRSRLRAAAGWPEDAVVVGMLARYSPVKGQKDLVEAARLLAPRHESARFFLAGPPGQTGRGAIERAVRDAGLTGRCFAGESIERPLEAAAGFDVAVIASRGSEAVCRSALEYMILGVPIVATDVNVIPETVGDSGQIVPPARPDALARGIETYLLDPVAAAEAGARGRARAHERFDRDRLAGVALEMIAEAAYERRA
jgi:glycosyltransferase involved in cell wall biosynthesis